jgi:hypothetical protein
MAADLTGLHACQYAGLAAKVSLLRTGLPAAVPPLACEIAATHRVRIEGRELGIAWWVVGEVCVMCAHMARDLPGYLGDPVPLLVPARIST